MKDQKLPDLIFPGQTATSRRLVAQLKSEGKIHPIGPRLYASVPKSEVKNIVRGSWSTVVSRLFPGVLLSHRSALDYRPDEKGKIYLTSSTQREVHYPGLTLQFLRGPAPLPTDPAFLNFFASSLPRALLENLSIARGNTKTKILPIEEIEAKLEQILHEKGEDALNLIRDQTRTIAKKLKWETEFKKLDQMVGALLGTRSPKKVKGDLAISRSLGLPYDSASLERLEILFGELRHYPLRPLPETNKSHDHFINKAFIESYFSNYIEGTQFEIEEAEEIVFDKKIPKNRPEDAHDILGTFKMVSDPAELRKKISTFEEFTHVLKKRHLVLLEGRTEAHPGEFKRKPNRAGNTHFVHPEYVLGTLKKGFELHQNLSAGFPRAAFAMFLVADVHPFTDGNGRIARILMNAELYTHGFSTVIIPTVYREDYLLALRALTRRGRAQPLIKMLALAQQFSHFDFHDYRKTIEWMQSRHWFDEPSEAKIVFP